MNTPSGLRSWAPQIGGGLLAASALTACAGGLPLATRVQDLGEVTRRAREQGAYQCAPEELARAEAELEFARAELALGDRARAEEHVVRAGANARAALRLSGDPSCRALETTSPEACRGGASQTRAAGVSAKLRLTQAMPRLGSTKEHVRI